MDEVAEVFAERTEMATALQETLLPPRLPDIAGAGLAARYRATGAGNLVGGGHPPPLVLRDDETVEWVEEASGLRAERG